MSSPFFSVVMPTYNQAHFLKKSIPSVLSQSWTSLELIIINNYSDDDTVQVVNSFSDPRISLINFRNHGVIGASRNVGVKAAKGQYVAFLDSDDFWYPTKLERVHSVLQENPETDLVCHDENLVEHGKITKVNYYGPYKTYEDLLFKGCCISTSAAVVRRNRLIEAGLFSENPEYIGVEDYELWLRLSKICHIEYLHVVLGEYHIHGTGISSNIENQVYHSLNVLNHHLSTLNGAVKTRMIRRRRALTFHGAGRTFQRRRQVLKSLRWYLRAIREYPILWKSYAAIIQTLMGVKA